MNEVALTLLRDLDESVAGHVLDTIVRLVHELEKLVDDGFEEFPVRAEEAWVLPDHVHDVRSDNSFVVLASLLLAKAKQILNFICKLMQ